MRIAIDLQGAQSLSSRNRGIGRYSTAIAKAIIQNAGNHEVFLVLSNVYPETVEPIRAQFEGLLPQDNIRVFQSLSAVAQHLPEGVHRRIASELAREAFIASLDVDLVHICSPMEGLTDDAVSSINTFYDGILTTVTLHDLIPLIHKDIYLRDPDIAAGYYRQIGNLCRANMLLANSQSSADEAIEHLGFSAQSSVNIGSAADEYFRKIEMSDVQVDAVKRRYGITQPFLMYTGGNDFRKNIDALVRAFSALPNAVREKHQLAIVCSFNEEDKAKLQTIAADHDLPTDALILTGFVSDEDLLALYNLCKLFVFPSWHEGFGLPILEAMRCGAPALGSDRSSIPEVLGWDEALFDPMDDLSIRDAMLRALTDANFMRALKEHCGKQWQNFSWDISGNKAINAFEILYNERQKNSVAHPIKKNKLAFISPMPPAASGIANYSHDILNGIVHRYDVDIVVEKSEFSKTLPIHLDEGRVKIISDDMFLVNFKKYDRVLYQIGNSSFHDYQIDLIGSVPGVMVLHDFFVSGLSRYQGYSRNDRVKWHNSLYLNHGFSALYQLLHAKDEDDICWNYPCNATFVENAKAVIVHSDYARTLAAQWLGTEEAERWKVVPLLRAAPKQKEPGVRQRLGLEADDIVFCCFGLIGSMKNNMEVLNGWIASRVARNPKAKLIFVGKNSGDDYGDKLNLAIKKSDLASRVFITGWIDNATFHDYLAICDIAVQLRTLSRGETSAAVLDCMAYGIPTIVNANGSMAELPRDSVYMLPDAFSPGELTDAIDTLHNDAQLRIRMGANARRTIMERHNAETCAQSYYDIIEHAYKVPSLIDAIVEQGQGLSLHELGLLSPIIRTSTTRPVTRTLYVDISVLVIVDAGSGIQRVVRSILTALMKKFIPGLRIEPVYYAPERKAYLNAMEFTRQFIELPEKLMSDDIVEFQRGDIFLGLDLCQNAVGQAEEILKKLRNLGIELHFIVYDLLPLTLPEYFPEGTPETHAKWLKVIAQMDSAICISRAVADELPEQLDKLNIAIDRPLAINWFHLGADIEKSRPTRGMQPDASTVLAQLRDRPSFLMVGTLEPRKGQADILAACEKLWSNGSDVNLVIVGKEGWKIENLAKILRKHSEWGKRLFWLNNVSDEYLGHIYETCDYLISASHGEGFGLPLIEAAKHNIPIIARNIPVFREVVGSNGTYFPKDATHVEIASILNGLLAKDVKISNGLGLSVLSWQDSAEALLACILEKRDPYLKWKQKDILHQ